MTKKHFEAIAKTLNKYYTSKDQFYHSSQFVTFTAMVTNLMDTFETLNPRFDRQRFITAVYA